ncbi:MAG: class I SAM-dependent methyltransferase [Thermodesulfovibrionales bacterium]|jgi:SAM-dependent methyltransferase
MEMRQIDWNRLWMDARTERTRKWDGKSFWNKRAPSFAKHATESGYAKDFLEIMGPEPHWTVLDVGCAAGTLAVPLSRKVQGITAMDISDVMLEMLDDRCRKQGIGNIRTIKGGWEDDWDSLGVGTHDVAIASRSLIVNDLRTAMAKLNNAARERVILSSMVGDGPFDRRIYEAVGRDLNRGPDYIYVYNLLHQMGIYAHLTFVKLPDDKTYTDHEACLNSLRWMLEDMTAEEEERLRLYLHDNLVERRGRWEMSYKKVVRWAVIWWDKKSDTRAV